MKNAPYLLILLLAVAACAPTRPSQPVVTDESEYYVANSVERPGLSQLGQKRLLPDPHGGLGTTNDLTLKVTDIRLTSQYTVLFLTFGEHNQATASYQSRSSNIISFNRDARLVAGKDANSLKTFKFIKAEGIVLSPDSQPVDPDEEVKFRLYFERLDRGTEDFSLFECEDTQTTTCWNVRGMHITNPADSTARPAQK
ncbi:MAG: hypothetical protein H7Z72_26735 [Bacteroidetes bacterium]|nr:hypothetical protein [Fibrella sp.]